MRTIEVPDKKKLVIFGLGHFADIAFEYFSIDSDYQVVAFTVHREFIVQDKHLGLPVIPFEEVSDYYDPSLHAFFAAVLYLRMNDFRLQIALEAKNMGYQLASYISSHAFIWRNVQLGEHCFIFEDNTIQPYVSIGFNNILWSGNHIGHHSRIGDNCFISSHVVISGSCEIRGSSFIGVNSTLSNNVSLGLRTWVGPGVLITKDVPEGSLVLGSSSKVRDLDEELLEQKLRLIALNVN
jgi:sugar O-acyltransferase (sialic acid O-acetyltransferase NeuD family)